MKNFSNENIGDFTQIYDKYNRRNCHKLPLTV